MQNNIENEGDSSIIMQDIHDSQITVVMHEGLSEEVKQAKNELKRRVEGMRSSIQEKLSALPESDVGQEVPENLKSDVRHTLRALKAQQRCVLFLGPEIALENKTANLCLHEQGYREIAQNDPGLHYNQSEGFFEPTDSATYELDLYDFYQLDFPQKNVVGKEILYHLGQLPFSLVLNFAPDETLHQIWDNYDRDHQFKAYKQGTAFPELSPNLDQPLLLNVLGAADTHGGNFVNTHKDFYHYIRGAELPSAVKKAIKEAVHLVFIGFDFSKWYTRLLLYLLDLSGNDKPSKRRHINPALYGDHEQIAQFLESQFSLSSVQHDYQEFAECLTRQAAAETMRVAQEEGKMAKDLRQFFFEKQLHKLQYLANRITDEDKLVSLNELRAELTSLEKKLDAHV